MFDAYKKSTFCHHAPGQFSNLANCASARRRSGELDDIFSTIISILKTAERCYFIDSLRTG